METDYLLSPWTWATAALALAAIETLAPVAIFLCLAAGALATSLLLVVMPDIGWTGAIGVFSITAVISLWPIKRWYLGLKGSGAEDDLGARGAQLIGREVMLVSPIEHGKGRAKVGDSYWNVTGPDCEAGRVIKIVSVNDAELGVVPVDRPK